MKDFDSLARQLSGLYDDSSCENIEDASPLYSELCEDSLRYSEKTPLAEGGMKSIFKVFDKSTGRYVALAELHAGTPEELREPFIREARLTALLEHPNIISIHDIGVSQNKEPFFIMDLKVGDTLGDILEKIRKNDEVYMLKYSLVELLKIFLKVCDAVSYAHSRDVIHLDLKPGNIQVGQYGEVLVCDWGLGKIIGSAEEETIDSLLINKDLLNNMTMSGQIKGTPGYMAPEQVASGTLKSAQTDIFALGCILYEILTFKVPFAGKNTEETLKNTEALSFRIPSKAIGSKVPSGLEAVVLKALKEAPQDRYFSVELLKKDINQYLSGYATLAENAGFFKEVSLFVKRNLRVCVVVFLSLFIIASLIAAFVIETQASYLKELEARKQAEEFQKRADYVAEQFKAERNESTRLIERLASQFKEEIDMMTKIYIFHQPKKSIDNALSKIQKTLEMEPNNLTVQSKYVYCLFLVQDFQAVLDIYNPAQGQHEDLFELSKKYVGELQEDGLLPIHKLAELIHHFPKIRRSHLVEKMLAYDEEKRAGEHNYSSVVKAILKVWNPEWDMRGFSLSKKQSKLTISSPQVSKLTYKPITSSNHSILRFLNINGLVLEGSGVYDLSDIQDLKISFLNICNTNINDLRPLSNFSNLKYLWVKKGQFSEKELMNVPENIKLVLK